MACLFLSEADAQALLDVPTAIEVVEEAFRRLGAGEADNVPRVRCRAQGIVLHSMSAAAEYLGVVGWKQYTTTPHGARFHVCLYDAATGEPVALVEANRLGQLRTGAATAVAIDRLAAAGADQLGLFGSGWQAEGQLAAVAAVRPIRRAIVYSPNAEHRVDFAQRMAERLQIEVLAADDPYEAASGLPIVVTATNSREPVLDGSWIAEGAVVCAIGSNWLNRAEIDTALVRRASVIACDSIAACRNEAGDFTNAIEQGWFDWTQAIELADLVSGTVARRGGPEIALFKSVGLAIEDVALAAKLVERARRHGRGIRLPL